MLGFDALGRLALGQIGHGGATTVTLTADAGSYTITGNAALFRTTFDLDSGSYALTGSAAGFATGFAAAAGSYSVTGNAAAFSTSLEAVAGSYTITGNDSLFSINWVCEAGSYTVTLGEFEFVRTGDEIDKTVFYGGVGHFLEELAKRRQLERITKKRPEPVLQRLPELRPFAVARPVVLPEFGVLTNPDALAGRFEAEAQQAQQMAAAQMQRQRNRRALTVLLLAA